MSEDDLIQIVAENVRKEVKEITQGKKTYRNSINVQLARQEVSPTFSKLLSKIDRNKLNSKSLPAALVGNIIISQVGNRFTQLLTQSLAVVVSK